MKARLALNAYVEGVRAGDRAVLGQAITLVESELSSDRALARALLEALAPDGGRAHRIGITGVPGVGKSTFIEALGKKLTAEGHRVAVLSVDPSSTRSRGSILGDKTRMQELSRDPLAFVRPSPTGGSLGGVARHTREAMLLCEAAGYELLFVETVGVGQSEITVAEMVDFFLALMLPGAGDELQGIKRGILEVADLIVVNKADADRPAAEIARSEYGRTLRLMQPKTPHWQARAMLCSALTGEGIDEVWSTVLAHREALSAAGAWEAQRAEQREAAMWRAFEARVIDSLRAQVGLRSEVERIAALVRAATMPIDQGVEALLEVLLSPPRAEG